jgi:histidine triad (HIT) family protein
MTEQEILADVRRRTPEQLREFDQSWGTNSAYVQEQHKAFEWHDRSLACPFCAILKGTAPAQYVRLWPEAVAIVPLNPVVPGHTLVIPRAHIEDATEDPLVAGTTMARAASLAPRSCNLITSAGAEATQTVWHLHIHIVPRSNGDGLALPWAPHPAS